MMKIKNQKLKIKNQKTKNSSAGFSLLEMLMVLAIFGILTSVTIFNYGNFNSNIIMTNLAYEVALSIREAQVFSLGVKGFGVNDFETNYGVFFDVREVPGSNVTFGSFADENNNQICDNCNINNCTSESECLSTRTMTRGVSIKNICGSNDFDLIDEGGNGNCLGTSVDQLSIIFERPSPRPNIVGDGDSYKNAAIILETSKGSERAVIIRETGQITVEFITNAL